MHNDEIAAPGKFSKMRLNVALLSTCQAFMFIANSVFIASAALIGAALVDNLAYATVPVSLVFIFGMGFAMPASMLMKYIGRRAGFQIGCATGCSGALVCGYAAIEHSFVFFCIGIALIGIHNAFAAFYRFAAVDVSTESYRSRAVSYVLAGSVVAAFIGPNMANLTRNMIDNAMFAGSYFSLAVCYALAFVVISFLQVPNESKSENLGPSRPLGVIVRQPVFVISVISATVGYGVMNLLMTSTPLAMQAREFGFMYTAQVIQWHIVAMFAPSFFTGHLIRKFGDLNIILAGLAALLCGIAAGLLLADTVMMFAVALMLIGIGWNFTYLGGTTLLTMAYDPAEKAKSQGFNDLCVFSVVSITAVLSGVLHHVWGWYVLCAVTAVPVLSVLALAGWMRFRSNAALQTG